MLLNMESFFSYFEDSVHSLIVLEKEHYIAHLCPIWMNSSKNYYDLLILWQ